MAIKGRVGRFLFGLYLAAMHLVLGYFLVERFVPNILRFSSAPAEIADPTGAASIPVANLNEESPSPLPSVLPTATATLQQAPSVEPGDDLIVPVVGVRREQLIDTFTQSRSGGRVHDAIDIPAAAGTPVVAAADGQITKFWDSVAGGTTIYQLTADKRYVLYYAHLQSRAAEIKEGAEVKRGTTIGFVGNTGNAGLGNYHLHFAIAIVEDPKRYWKGTYINPYPLLRTPSKLP